MPVASVIVPARNAARTIGRTLDGLGRQDLARSFDVIVVDNGSEDDTAAVAARAIEAAQLDGRVVRQHPERVSSARNRGVAESEAALLAFIDADCFPSPAWLREGLAALEGADLVQGAVCPDPTAVRSPFDRTVTVSRETGLYETASLFVRRSIFDAVGGFVEIAEPAMGAPFGEDVWFGWRAKRSGARTAFAAGALAYHAVFPRAMAAYADERRRAAYFPALVRQIPELRKTFLWRRWFLTRRSAAFDTAVIGALGAIALRAGWPLGLAAPYAWLAVATAMPWGEQAPRAFAGNLWADSVACVSLLRGSAEHRTLVT